MCTAISRASTQKPSDNLEWWIMDTIHSWIVRFICSTILFCSGLWGFVYSRMMLRNRKNLVNSSYLNSYSLSIRRNFSFPPWRAIRKRSRIHDLWFWPDRPTHSELNRRWSWRNTRHHQVIDLASGRKHLNGPSRANSTLLVLSWGVKRLFVYRISNAQKTNYRRRRIWEYIWL